MPSSRTPSLAEGLRVRGLADGDVSVLERQLDGLRVEGCSPLEVLRASVPLESFDLLLTSAMDALAFGPHGRFAAGWRRLFAEGCPLDRLWCILWHSFSRPDECLCEAAGWLPEPEALAHVERYVDLGFPQLSAVSHFGVGLGCAALLDNVIRATPQLVRLLASPVHIASNLDIGRAAFTAAARAEIDRRVGIAPEHLLSRPSDDRLAAIVTKLRRSERLTPTDEAFSCFLQLPPGREDVLLLDDVSMAEVDVIAARWIATVSEMRDGGQLVVDLGTDRYRLAREAPTPCSAARRPGPTPPVARSPALATLLDALRRDGEPRSSVAEAARLEHEDPLLWLADVARMASAGAPVPA